MRAARRTAAAQRRRADQRKRKEKKERMEGGDAPDSTRRTKRRGRATIRTLSQQSVAGAPASVGPWGSALLGVRRLLLVARCLLGCDLVSLLAAQQRHVRLVTTPVGDQSLACGKQQQKKKRSVARTHEHTAHKLKSRFQAASRSARACALA